jgi:hypothetical protein
MLTWRRALPQEGHQTLSSRTRVESVFKFTYSELKYVKMTIDNIAVLYDICHR